MGPRKFQREERDCKLRLGKIRKRERERENERERERTGPMNSFRNCSGHEMWFNNF